VRVVGRHARATRARQSATLTRRSRSVFYDCFFLDGVRIALHDCVGVALKDEVQTARRRRATP
jgi:hypothetical protein